MSSDPAPLRLLLDEHYPGWLAEGLTKEGIDTVALIAHRPELRGADDRSVLEAATAEGRMVVTEDVATFAVAIRAVPEHLGVIYCHLRGFRGPGRDWTGSATRSSRWPTLRHLAWVCIPLSGGCPSPPVEPPARPEPTDARAARPRLATTTCCHYHKRATRDQVAGPTARSP